MGDIVYANGMSVLHKGSAGKSMAAMPDVCLCPPPAPTGPVPTPLPNNSLSSDIDGCAKSVLIEGNPAGTKDSFLKTSTGNEPSKPTGGGVVSHATKGKTYFVMGSIDVLFEGVGAVRHLDTGTHNHNPTAGNTPPWPTLAAQMFKQGGVCEDDDEACKLVPFEPNKCPDAKTPHHVLPAHCFLKTKDEAADVLGKFADVAPDLGTRELNEKGRKIFQTRKGEAVFKEEGNKKIKGETVTPKDVEGSTWPGCEKYRSKDAPCICVSGHSQHLGDHGVVHAKMDQAEANACARNGGTWTLDDATKEAAASVKDTPGCSEACIAAQLDAYHVDECGMDKKTTSLRADQGTIEQRQNAQRLVEQERRTDPRGNRRR